MKEGKTDENIWRIQKIILGYLSQQRAVICKEMYVGDKNSLTDILGNWKGNNYLSWHCQMPFYSKMLTFSTFIAFTSLIYFKNNLIPPHSFTLPSNILLIYKTFGLSIGSRAEGNGKQHVPSTRYTNSPIWNARTYVFQFWRQFMQNKLEASQTINKQKSIIVILI